MNTTFEYYNNNAQSYIEKTINLNISHECINFVSQLPKKSLILDIGCGSGRDSLFFKSQDMNVVCIEPSKELSNIASKILKQEVLNLSIQDVNFDSRHVS